MGCIKNIILTKLNRKYEKHGFETDLQKNINAISAKQSEALIIIARDPYINIRKMVN